MTFRFRKFPIYQKIREFIKDIYSLANKLPKTEKFGIISQLTRAAISILLNLAEGSMRRSDKELNRFLLISLGSVGEVASILDICFDLDYISSSTHEEYMIKCESLAKQLYGFARSLK